MGTAKKPFSVGGVVLWILVPSVIFIVWTITDVPSDPVQQVNGIVTGSILTTKNTYLNVIEFSNGSVIRQSSGISLQAGTQVPCLRYTRRISRLNYYERPN